MECTLECLHLGIAAARPLGSIRAIGAAITEHAEANGFSVVRIFQGHGIGRKFHQAPGIPHFPGHALTYNPLIPGMCFTIEPMINAGTHQCAIDMLGDGWTARTTDGGLSAQFEHTLLMGETGPEILTLTNHGPQPPCRNPVPEMDLTCGEEGSHELRRYCSEECADREGKAELASLGITPEMMKDAMDGYYECREMIEKSEEEGPTSSARSSGSPGSSSP